MRVTSVGTFPLHGAGFRAASAARARVRGRQNEAGLPLHSQFLKWMLKGEPTNAPPPPPPTPTPRVGDEVKGAPWTSTAEKPPPPFTASNSSSCNSRSCPFFLS